MAETALAPQGAVPQGAAPQGAAPEGAGPKETGTKGTGAKPAGRSLPRRIARAISGVMPKGLYPRSLIIIITPVVLLQSVIAYVFMERHWQLVTQRLSAAVTSDIAALIDLHGTFRDDPGGDTLSRIAAERLALDVQFMPGARLPAPGPKPFFSLLDEALSDEITRQIGLPFWIDTVGRSNWIEIRVLMKDGVLRVTARRSQAYASNSHIFLLWMVGTSLILLGVAILFLRNQIRPIQRLATAAEDFGRGREIEFRPRGAREVRQAGHAFIEMKRRIERTIDQRTTMLNGVSHDLRTILTRFRLSLALIDQTSDVDDLKRDVDEMGRMLEGYLAFARGDLGEPTVESDLAALFSELKGDAERSGHQTSVEIAGDPMITVRADAFRRLMSNLLSNAARHGDRIAISASHETRWLVVNVDDDGPGISPEAREEVFRPFVRLDEARNQDEGGSGLGLAIARDIARSHGGDIVLGASPLGGLRATVRLPA